MSGLATGRNPAEYLECGACEERAISLLCAAVSPAEAAQLLTECISTFLISHERTTPIQRRETGSWSRLAVLERRILDRDSFADVDGSQRRGLECTITGAFCSAPAQADVHAVAVLICLIRRLFLPAGLSKGSEIVRAGFEDHEKWLKDLVRTNGGKIAKGLIKALSDLVPLEPIRFLRTNHRVFSANRQYLHLFGDYLVQVRSRIGDLDPLHHVSANASGHSSRAIPNEPNAYRKAEEDVVKFVTEFAEAGGKIPASLVRQMNFHRYHFRASTLPALLNPNFEASNGNGSALRMDRDTFDEHRTNLIKVMAFKRKDQAVTTSEAQSALKEMKEAKQKRIAQYALDAEVRPGSTSKDSVLNEGDSLVQMIESVIKHAALKSSSEKTSNRGSVLKPTTRLEVQEQLQTALMLCKDATELGGLASEILQGVLNGLTSEKDSHSDGSGDELFDWYTEWWDASGTVLYAFLADMVGHEDMRKVQKPLQYHLFVLLCIRNQHLTDSLIVALAKVISVVCLLARAGSFADICFTASSDESTRVTLFPSMVFDSLPVMDPVNVRLSVRFALHCVCLLKAVQANRNWLSSRLHKSRMQDLDQGTDLMNPSLAIEPLTQLLRWTMSAPWRLLTSRSSCQRRGSNDNAAIEAATLFRKIVDMFSSEKLYMGMKPRIREWLRIEYRCGWGRPSSVRKILQYFEHSGTDASELIAETSMFVAVSNSGTCGNADWIAQGVRSFAEDSLTCKGRVSNSIRDKRQLFPLVRKCVGKSGTSAGRCILDMVSGTSFWYFQNCSLADAELHMGQFLIPSFWPFSNRWLKYLVNSLNRIAASATIHNLDGNGCMFLISNITMNWDMVGDDLLAMSPSSAFLEPLLSKARKIVHEVDALTGCGRMQVTQGPSIASSTSSSVSEQFPYAFGMALTLFFAKKSLYCKCDSQSNSAAASNAVGQLVSNVSSIAAADVIDAAMHTAALIPFSCLFSDLDVYDAAVTNMETVLSALLVERLRLTGVPLPAWIREKLGFSLRVEDDLRRLLWQWLGKAAGVNVEGQRQYLKTSLAIAGCMAKIFSILTKVPAEELSLFVSTVGYETITTALVPNILTVYAVITGKESDFAEEQLSDDGMDRLLSFRVSAGPILLDVVSRLISILQSSSMNNIEGHIRSMLLAFPDHAEEVSLTLRTRSNLNL